MPNTNDIVESFLLLFPDYQVSFKFNNKPWYERVIVSCSLNGELIARVSDTDIREAQLKAFDTVIDLQGISGEENEDMKKDIRELKDSLDIEYLYMSCVAEANSARERYRGENGRIDPYGMGLCDGFNRAANIIDPHGTSKYYSDSDCKYLNAKLKTHVKRDIPSPTEIKMLRELEAKVRARFDNADESWAPELIPTLQNLNLTRKE